MASASFLTSAAHPLELQFAGRVKKNAKGILAIAQKIGRGASHNDTMARRGRFFHRLLGEA